MKEKTAQFQDYFSAKQPFYMSPKVRSTKKKVARILKRNSLRLKNLDINGISKGRAKTVENAENRDSGSPNLEHLVVSKMVFFRFIFVEVANRKT